MSGRSSPVFARGRGDRPPRLRSPCTTSLSLTLAAALLAFSLNLRELTAQVTVDLNVTEVNPAAARGFSIAFDDRLAETLARFDEFVRTRTWEKAFRILADIPEDKWSAMLPDAHGLIRPASLRVRDAVLELPADGREAYRLYFDAKARRLLESMQNARKEQDIRIAETIFDRYFITSVGDDAGDRLAEDYFERGQFAEAARCWKLVLDFHPDTNLSEPRILVKRAIALLRGGLDAEFRSVRQELKQSFPGVRMTLGGREVAAEDYLNRLESEEKPKPAATEKIRAESVFQGLAPPDGTQPAWQFRFIEEKDLSTLEDAARNVYGVSGQTTVVPAAVTDGERLYGNWMGTCFAIDVATGKTAWTTEPDVKTQIARLRTNSGRMTLYSTNTGQFAVSLGHDGEGAGVVLSVAPAANESARFHLAAFDASNGHELWTTDRATSELAHASFIGTPLVNGNSVYALTHQVAAENQKANGAVNVLNFNSENAVTASALVLRCLELRTGTEIWSLSLGTPQFLGTAYGQQFLPIPALVLSGSRLHVLTNDGALVAVSVDRRQIEWIFKYAPPNAGQTRQAFFSPARMPGRQARSTGPIVVRDGVIYFKESMSAILYALDESTGRLRWKWEDSELTNLVGMDDRDVYLFYGELSAIARTKPETHWSNKLTVELPGIGAQIGSRAILVFTSRGLFELSKETGDVRRIFRGADQGAIGGFVLSAGRRLLCVSNLAVTAYADTQATGAAKNHP